MTTIQLITRPEEVVELLANLIEQNSGPLGVEFVGKYDEKMLPRYPSVVVSAGPFSKEVHGTHTFALELRAIIWVYHANLTLTHAQRSKEDLELATSLVALIEDDKTFEEQLIFSFVESETPGVIAPRAGRGEPVVGTRLNWMGVTQQRWA